MIGLAICTALVAGCVGQGDRPPAKTTGTQPETVVPPTATLAAKDLPVFPTASPTSDQVSISLWYGYEEGGSEERALDQLLQDYALGHPERRVVAQQVPFGVIFDKWETAVATGGGPDLMLAPNDRLGTEARAGLLLPLDPYLTGRLNQYTDTAVRGGMVDGQTWIIPESLKAVGLYYNRSAIPDPPQTTDDLLALVKSGKRLLVYQYAYHVYGWFSAFGGQLADSSGRCIADQGGVVDAIQYLVGLKNAGASFETDSLKGDMAFRQGQVDMVINGPWALNDYRKDLRDQLGVIAMPAGPKGAAAPLVAPDGFYVNPNTKNPDAAVDLALSLTSPASEKVFVDVAGHVPAQAGVSVSDPLVRVFMDAAEKGTIRPQAAWIEHFWTPFGNMLPKVLAGRVTPEDGVREACTEMNQENNFK